MWAAAASAGASLYALQLSHSPAAQAQQQLLAECQRREVERHKAMPRPKFECDGCGAADFDHRGCTYCRRPRLDPTRIATSGSLAQLGGLYGYTSVRPRPMSGGGMLLGPEDR